MRGERWWVGFVLAGICAALAVLSDQPIVENYVGRQIPTAMVARNLGRGSGFLHPTLDTAPFPNRFWVEPPIYAQMVAWVKASIGFVSSTLSWPPIGFVWERSGRLVSAAMTTLGAWAFWGLVRRREGSFVALAALASFGLMPVTLRFGRAFQPDATMVGFVLLGLRAWDEFQAGGWTRYALVGGFVLALGLATKVTVAWVLIPFALVVTRWPLRGRLGAGVLMLVPALAWYGYAWSQLDPGSSQSRASADNAALWLGTLGPTSWFRFATWRAIALNLGVRAFTPMAAGLVVLAWLAGWTRSRSERLADPDLLRPWRLGDPLWRGWVLGVGLAVGALAAKWHHLYYWLVAAPPVALLVGRAYVSFCRVAPGNFVGLAIPAALLGLNCFVQTQSTWRSPPGWESIRESGARIAAIVPPESALIAPEAVLFYADRPGLRLEFDPTAARRAAGEWGAAMPIEPANDDPLALVDFYARQAPGDPSTRFGEPPRSVRKRLATRFVADVGPTTGDPRRSAWRAALRRRPNYSVLIDEPNLILARIAVWPRVAANRADSPTPSP